MNDETYTVADYTPVIGIFAEDRAGKDTVARHLMDSHDFMRVAFADPLKECLRIIDPEVTVNRHGVCQLSVWLEQLDGDDSWLKEHSSDYRNLLRRFGTDLMRNHLGMNRIWVDQLKMKLNSIDSWLVAPAGVVIPDVREVEQARMIVEELGGYIIELRSNRGEGHYADDEEVAELRDMASYTLTNNGTLEDLHYQIDSMVEAVSKDYDNEYPQEEFEYDCD